jgi:hypothetical protein
MEGVEEYWINVYYNPHNNATWLGSPWPNPWAAAIRTSGYTIYRIHVKLK